MTPYDMVFELSVRLEETEEAKFLNELAPATGWFDMRLWETPPEQSRYEFKRFTDAIRLY